jgi:hypothetical protein
MDNGRPPKLPAGPPRKGFWGFIASLFPKRPDLLEPPDPTEPVRPAVNDGSKNNPASTDSGEIPGSK